MKHRDDLDRLLTVWLDDPYTPPAPHYLDQVLERTRRTRQRPAWTNLERWLPMADKIARPASGPQRMAWILLIALLVVAVAAAAVFVGSRIIKSTAPDNGLNGTVEIPRGGAAVLAFGSLASGPSGQATGDIFTVRADGTDMRQLTTGPGMETYPTWSPDGTRIAYRLWEGGTESILVMDAGGGNRATLATDAQFTQDCVKGLVWSPDGTNVLFATSAVCPSQFDLFVVAADASSPATKLLAPGVNSTNGAWSPDGKQIALLGTEGAGTIGVYVVDVGPGSPVSGGLRARRIAPGPSGPLGDVNYGPQWSPDGTELAVVNETRGVTVMKADGSSPRVVAEKADYPTWSPDGRELAFVRAVDPSEYFQGRPCTVRTWIVKADGTNERQLNELGDGCGFPRVWSPDGTRLASMLLVATPADPTINFHVGIVTIDGSVPPVILPDGTSGSWQPVAAPLPAAPSFTSVSPSP